MGHLLTPVIVFFSIYYVIGGVVFTWVLRVIRAQNGLISASQNLMRLRINWGSCYNLDPDPLGLRWGLRVCMSNKPADAAAAADSWATL